MASLCARLPSATCRKFNSTAGIDEIRTITEILYPQTSSFWTLTHPALLLTGTLNIPSCSHDSGPCRRPFRANWLNWTSGSPSTRQHSPAWRPHSSPACCRTSAVLSILVSVCVKYSPQVSEYCVFQHISGCCFGIFYVYKMKIGWFDI